MIWKCWNVNTHTLTHRKFITNLRALYVPCMSLRALYVPCMWLSLLLPTSFVFWLQHIAVWEIVITCYHTVNSVLLVSCSVCFTLSLTVACTSLLRHQVSMHRLAHILKHFVRSICFFYSRRLASTAVNVSIGGFFTIQDQIPKHTDRGKKCVYVCRVWHHSA